MNLSRRKFIRFFSLCSAGTSAGFVASLSGAQTSPKAGIKLEERLSIPDDWWVGGYKVCYHGRAKDPKRLVDLVTMIGRTGGCSAGFLRRLAVAISDDSNEASEAIAYLNRGIRDGWLVHGRPRPSGIPLETLKQSYDGVPCYAGTEGHSVDVFAGERHG